MTAEELVARARSGGMRLAVAESCTGGLLAAEITRVPGASDVFDRGVVTYSNGAKSDLLGVRPETLASEGAVSEAVAGEMAEGMLARADAQVAVAITGIAGPGGSEHKPEGRVCFGVASTAGAAAHTVEFGALGRDAVRAAAVAEALRMLGRAMDER